MLVAAWVLQCVGIVYTLSSGYLAAGCPLESDAAVQALLVALVCAFAFVRICKFSARVLGGQLSRRVLVNDPLKDPRTMRKFEDQTWQLVLHTTMTILELYILKVEDGGKAWLEDPKRFWMVSREGGGERPTPTAAEAIFHEPHSPVVHLLFLVQAAAWIATCFSHVCFEERRRDYLMMLAHHVVTIGLIWLSYTFNFVRVGTVVLFVHDASDIVIDLLKVTNYLQLEGPSGLFLVEASYVTNLLTWAYFRLYVLPVKVIWRGIINASREVATAPGVPGMEAFSASVGSEHTRGHPPGYVLDTSYGDGSFDIFANIRALPAHENIPMFWTASCLLVILNVMHVVWYLLMLNIGRKMLYGQAPSTTGEEEYEGEQYAGRTLGKGKEADDGNGTPSKQSISVFMLKLALATLLCAVGAAYLPGRSKLPSMQQRQ